MGSHWVLTLFYLKNVLYWPEDDRLRSKHVTVMWPDCVYYITVLIYCCVLTVYNILYKKSHFAWTVEAFREIISQGKAIALLRTLRQLFWDFCILLFCFFEIWGFYGEDTEYFFFFVRGVTPSCCLRETCFFNFQARASVRTSCDFY